MNPRSEVLNIDCLEYMRGLPDKAFALAIADPPYGINAPNMHMGGTKEHPRIAQRLKMEHSEKGRLNSGGGKLKNRLLNSSMFEWDNAAPSQTFFDELFRVCENVIIWGGNYFNLPPTRCVIAWDKCQPWPNFSQIELAWTSFDKPAKLFKFDNRTNDKIHPTQKPVALYAWLLQNFAPPFTNIRPDDGFAK
jgi:site-specific DNA-methyltransferase (adenine-specific)